MNYEELKKKSQVKFLVSKKRYFIAKLKALPAFSGGMFCMIDDGREVTLVAEEGVALDIAPSEKEQAFRLITFDLALPFELTGFICHVSTLLADEQIPIFVVSAYSTDHILVREKELGAVIELLRHDGMVQS